MGCAELLMNMFCGQPTGAAELGPAAFVVHHAEFLECFLEGM